MRQSTAKKQTFQNIDLLTLGDGHRVSCWADVQKREPSDWVVIAEFSRDVQIPTSDDDGVDTGRFTDATTLGIVMSSRKQLEWIRKLILHLETATPYFVMVIQADGTYRLSKGTTKTGAVLVDVGIHDLRFNSARDKDEHNFIPLFYMFCQTECFEAYHALFLAFRNLPTTHLDLPGRQIRPDYGSLDRAAYIAKAYDAVWPAETR